MTTTRAAGARSVIDVLDHVLDKGVTLDGAVRLSGPAINAVEGRVVVVSSEAYLEHWDTARSRCVHR